MTETQTLLAQFARDGSESPFRELVSRYINLVYSTALRLAGGDTHLAEDIAQVVFADLAGKARSLPENVMLGGWLHQHTRFVASKVMRSEHRRLNRERQAAAMNAQDDHSEANLARIAPILDEAISQLGFEDRTAILLRYFEEKDHRAVGEALGTSEEAARKRVDRALHQLERLLRRRGLALPAVALSSLLAAHAVTAAPTGLAATVAGNALAGISSSTGVIATLLTLSKSKIAISSTLLIIGAAVVTLVELQSQRNTSTTRTRDGFAAGTNGPAGRAIVAVQSGASATPKANLLAEAANPAEAAVREPFASTVHMTLGVPPGAVAIQPDGKIIIGTTLSGFSVDDKTGVLGAYLRGAIRLGPTGDLDRTFFCRVNDSGACDPTRAHLDVCSNGHILMTGLFNSVDDRPRPSYGLLNADGSVDESFEPWRGETSKLDMKFNYSATFPAALTADGSIAVGNSAIEGERGRPPTGYWLDRSGRRISTTDTNLPLPEFSRPSGLILTFGPLGFWTRRPIDWTRDTRAGRRPDYLAEFSSCDFPFERWTEMPSAADAAAVFRTLFDEVPFELCRYGIRLPDGGAVLAIREEFVNGTGGGRGRFMRFDKAWHPDSSFKNDFEGGVRSCITARMQKDGKLLVAGIVGKLNGEPFPGLVRLEKDGSVDSTFHCQTTDRKPSDPGADQVNARVIGMAVQDDGKIVISGYFAKVNGIEHEHLARLNPDGSVDETFRPPFTTWEGLKAWRRVPVHRLSESKAITSPASDAAAANSAATNAARQTVLLAMLEMRDGVAIIRYTGQAGQRYILQASDNLNSGEWSNVNTNQPDASGAGLFRDEEAGKHPTRFYRIAVQ